MAGFGRVKRMGEKKSPLSSGLESISLEEIEETGTIVLRRTRIVQ
jgi:hypothetical protein